MKEFIKRPKAVSAAIERARKAENEGLLLTPLKRYRFEHRKNYSDDSDDFSTERGELFIAFCKESKNYESEFWLNSKKIINSPTLEVLDSALLETLERIIAYKQDDANQVYFSENMDPSISPLHDDVLDEVLRKSILRIIANTESSDFYGPVMPLNHGRTVDLLSVDNFEVTLWNVLRRMISIYGDIRYDNKELFSQLYISEKALFEHMIVIYNGESDFVHCVCEDDIRWGYFSKPTNIFYSDSIRLYLNESLLLIRDDFATLEELLDLIKSEED